MLFAHPVLPFNIPLKIPGQCPNPIIHGTCTSTSDLAKTPPFRTETRNRTGAPQGKMVSAKVWESLNSALHVYVHETVEKHTRLLGLSGLPPVWKVHCLAHAVFCFVPLGPRPMSISSESWRMTEKHGEVKEETFRVLGFGFWVRVLGC